MKKTVLPKQQVCRLAGALSLFVSITVFGNSTGLILPVSDHGAGEIHSEYHASWHDNDDVDQGFKKRPRLYGGLETTPSSLWLVPVLRYLVTANGKGTGTSEALVIWLPVVLETVAGWWFHEEQLQERLRQEGETLQGQPVPVNQLPDYDVQSKKEESLTDGGQSSGSRRGQPGRSAGILFRKDNEQTFDGDEEPTNKPKHECSSLSCPACNFEPCHCIRCAEQPVITENKAFSKPVRKSEARVWQDHRVTNIVQMLARREVAGRFPVPQAQLTSVVSQSRLEREYLTGSNIVPAFSQWCRRGDFCRSLICIADNQLVVLTWEGACFIWKQSGREWNKIVLCESGREDFLTDRRVAEVIAISDRMVVLAAGALPYPRTPEEKSSELVIWVDCGSTWKIEKKFPFGSVPHHLTLVSGHFLLFCLGNGLGNKLFGLTRNDETGWSTYYFPSDILLGMGVLSDEHFLILQEKITRVGEDLKKERLLLIWSELDRGWQPRCILRGGQSIEPYGVKSCINALMEHVDFQQIITSRRQISYLVGGVDVDVDGILPDGRYAELFLRVGDLIISIADSEKMIVSDSQFTTFFRRLLLLSDGRVADVDGSGWHVRIWMEENGKWVSVYLPSTNLSHCARLYDRGLGVISGLTELSELRLAVLYKGGLVEIWDLMLPAGRSAGE